MWNDHYDKDNCVTFFKNNIYWYVPLLLDVHIMYSAHATNCVYGYNNVYSLERSIHVKNATNRFVKTKKQLFCNTCSDSAGK